MYRVLKIVLIILSVFTLYYQTTVFAFVNQSVNQKEDPCGDLNGKWQGDWNNTYDGCQWKITVDAAIYKENVQLIVKFSNEKKCLPEFSSTITGTCTDGNLNLVLHGYGYTSKYQETKMTGRVFGKILTLEGQYRDAHAYKQS